MGWKKWDWEIKKNRFFFYKLFMNVIVDIFLIGKNGLFKIMVCRKY